MHTLRLPLNFFMLAFATAFFSSCTKEEATPEMPGPAQTGNVVVSQNIATSTTWTSDKVYQLAGRITVLPGVTLTIEPGTVIKGEAGTGANATALLVARGAKLIAGGTAEAPIVFTSVADEITPEDIKNGQVASPNLDPTINGLWGGLIVLGRAPISASSSTGDISEVQIEGIPTSDSYGLYGGNLEDDNSGTLRYISIRHGGANIGAGNEINGLTLGGVGSATVVDHIEVVANQDDGVELFGGSVNPTNLVVWNCGDDGIDTDQSYSGTVSNFVVAGVLGHAFELDGPEGSLAASHTIRGGSIRMSMNGRLTEDLINVDNNTLVSLEDLWFTDIQDGQRINNVSAPGVSFTNVLLHLATEAIPNHVNGTVPSGVMSGSTPQADLGGLGWTWAFSAGVFSGL